MNKIITIFLMSILIVGCQQTIDKTNRTDNTSVLDDILVSDVFDRDYSIVKKEDSNITPLEDEIEEYEEQKVSYTLNFKEGEIVNLASNIKDPDGDELILEFSEPMGKDGTWQTKIGDAGEYIVMIKASDGEFTITDYVKIIVDAVNRPPEIIGKEVYDLKEGDILELDFEVSDYENDNVNVKISGFTKNLKKEITFDHAYPEGCDEKGCVATYKVLISASDDYQTTKKEITIFVDDVNREPQIIANNLILMEGETINYNYSVIDPDNDELNIILETPEFGFEPQVGDAGEYNIVIKASDGFDEVEKIVDYLVIPKNHLPEITVVEEITLEEGDSYNLEVDVTDKDGDDVIINFSGFSNSSLIKIDYETAYPKGCDEKGCTAEYEVLITAFDGKDTSQKTVKILVKDKITTIKLSEFELKPLEPTTKDHLTSSIVYNDENNLGGFVLFKWFINGEKVLEEEILSESGKLVESKLESQNFKKDDVVLVEVSASNELFESEIFEAATTIKNSPPVFIFP